jgi:hypothetical protein
MTGIPPPAVLTDLREKGTAVSERTFVSGVLRRLSRDRVFIASSCLAIGVALGWWLG